MYEARLDGIRPYGLKLSENLFFTKFRVYRDCDGNGKMKTHRLLGLDAGLEKTCKAILYLRGMEYRGTLVCDETVRMHVPRNIVSYLFNGSEDGYVDLWLLLRRENGCVEIFDLGQRMIDDYALDGLGLLTIVGMKSPRYCKGYKYCSSCREAFLTVSKLCPRCGLRLRSKPRRVKNNGLEMRNGLETLLEDGTYN
jgi:hypothetical protein